LEGYWNFIWVGDPTRLVACFLDHVLPTYFYFYYTLYYRIVNVLILPLEARLGFRVGRFFYWELLIIALKKSVNWYFYIFVSNIITKWPLEKKNSLVSLAFHLFFYTTQLLKCPSRIIFLNYGCKGTLDILLCFFL
jgi:hypothetical protein